MSQELTLLESHDNGEKMTMTRWGKFIEVDKLPDIATADRDMIYVLPDGTDWLSSKNWCCDNEQPIWRSVMWAFGVPCSRCGNTGELYDGLTRCPNCVPDTEYV